MGKYLNYNGELLLSAEPHVQFDNRAFNYGDGFFETIRCLSSKPLFFKNHFERIVHSLGVLKMAKPTEWTPEFFESQIYRLLQRNRIYKAARVRITFFRSPGGLYTPSDNMPCYTIVASELPGEFFVLNKKGVKVGIYTDELKPLNKFSSIKSCNALFYVLAGLWKNENSLNDCLLLNEKGKIVEALSSNIFLVKDNALYTPFVGSGCVDGTMRKTILNLAQQKGVPIKENNGFDEKTLYVADEVFLTNAIQGIVPVSGYGDRRYYHTMAAKFIAIINQSIKID